MACDIFADSIVLRLGPANGALRKLSQSKECESSAASGASCCLSYVAQGWLVVVAAR